MLSEISAAISGFQASIGIVSSALQAKADSKALGEVIKLQSQIAQIQEIAIKTQAEYMNLVAEIERLKSWNEEKDKYEPAYDGKYFYFYKKKPEYCENETDETAKYCHNCFQEKRLRIPTPGISARSNAVVLICPACKAENIFKKPSSATKPRQ